MSIVKGTHDCNKHYERKIYQKPFTCDGCKMNGFGRGYICKHCGKKLHKECRYPKTEISHEFLGCSTLTFLEKPFTTDDSKKKCRECSKCCDACRKEIRRIEYSRYCNACGKDICGFSYHCKADDLDLHPCCRNLEKKLLINDTIFDLQAKVSSKCIWCKKRKTSAGKRDAPGWSYVSTCEKYHFHVYCMTEMTLEACMKNGEMGLEKVELRQLVKSRRNRGSGISTMFKTIKSILKIVLAALLGDPTLLISNALVELVSRGLK